MSARLRDALIEMISVSEAHVAVVAAHACQSNIGRIRQIVALFPGAEIYATRPAGEMVITLATDQAAEILAQFKAIYALPGVYSATLVDPHRRDEAFEEDILDRAEPSHP
jgi:periplasmic nitrate reductase NapD